MKRLPDVRQIGFTFDPPTPASGPADLAGLDRTVAAAVARILKDDVRSREEVAGAMSALLDETVSKAMLDAYASESREGHNISAARLLALVAATDRFDLLDRIVRRAGVSLLVGPEIILADMADLRLRMREMGKLLKTKEAMAVPRGQGRAR